MRKAEFRSRLAAYHEAGHAVAGLLLGFEPSRVFLAPRGGGGCEFGAESPERVRIRAAAAAIFRAQLLLRPAWGAVEAVAGCLRALGELRGPAVIRGIVEQVLGPERVGSCGSMQSPRPRPVKVSSSTSPLGVRWLHR